MAGCRVLYYIFRSCMPAGCVRFFGLLFLFWRLWWPNALCHPFCTCVRSQKMASSVLAEVELELSRGWFWSSARRARGQPPSVRSRDPLLGLRGRRRRRQTPSSPTSGSALQIYLLTSSRDFTSAVCACVSEVSPRFAYGDALPLRLLTA